MAARSLVKTILVMSFLAGSAPWLWAQRVQAGAGAYWLNAKGTDPETPAAPGRTEAMLRTAAQTNQWYSSLIFSPTPEVIYAQPLTFRPTPAGLEVALPRQVVVPTVRKDTEIHYPHADPVLVAPEAFVPVAPKLSAAWDWSIEVAFGQGADLMRATVLHGSPFTYLRVSRGGYRLTLPEAGSRLPAPDPRMLVLRAKGRTWAFFGPTGVVWEPAGERQWLVRLPAGKDHLAVAALPDEAPETLALFLRHAYAFPGATRVAWRYDQAASRVETTFQAEVQALEGARVPPLLGLYPHHWHGNASVADRLGPAYDSLRGKIRLLAADAFQVTVPYGGFVPWWPGLKAPERRAELQELLDQDRRNARRMMLEIGNGPYWQGKGLQRIAHLMSVAEQQGDQALRDQLLALMKGRIESWFSGESRKTYFQHSRKLGTVVAHPEEYFSIAQMNDHHFHYGYWIRTMAEIALRDPAWASRSQWGAMTDLLVADIATTTRGGADFPFLRAFDPYEGHAWASGIGLGPYGNNQESSSEAVNAWVGLILWGEVQGDRALRDLGVWLYTTEIQSIQHYWFDLHHLVLPPAYKNTEVAMLFGGKYAHNTWWTDEPRQIKGINLLPITPASLYLGRDPGYVVRSLAELPAQSATHALTGRQPDPPDIWQDIFAKYLALADPQAARAAWKRWGAVEFGDTRSHAFHWIQSLGEMGTPDFSLTADAPLACVFRRPDGVRTYLAYNAGSAPLVVTFSDGTRLEAAPRTLARKGP